LKPRTLNDHESHYRYLQRWLTEHHPTLKLEELTTNHVRKYVQHMLTEQTLYDGHPTLQSYNTAKGLSPATVNIRTRTLKCFLRFLHDEGQLQTDLAARIKLQKVAEDTIGAFKNEQVLQVLAAPNQREYTDFRDYVLHTMLFDTGLRINEALNLTDRTTTVRASVAKNGKSGVVPMSKRAAELLDALSEENRKQFANRNPSEVFLLNNGKPLTYNQAYERIRLHGEKAGITLQKILGHHDFSMVRKYV
jgi:integrase/recombinase XerD